MDLFLFTGAARAAGTAAMISVMMFHTMMKTVGANPYCSQRDSVFQRLLLCFSLFLGSFFLEDKQKQTS
jgi:hypothetical protein